MKEHNFKFEDIANIDIDASTTAWFAVRQPREVRWNPQTIPEGQFSLPYVAATAAYDGNVLLDSYTPQARTRQDVQDLMTRISARED